jgi:hypothetical protein
MTFGPDILVRCPACRNLYIRNSIGTVNSFGARSWTDGWVDSPMVPHPPLVTWCEKCRAWFFLEDAATVAELPFGTDPGEHKVIPVGDSLSIDSYREVLGSSWPPEREALLRIRLMWEYNHLLRYSIDRSEPATVESHDNLERLTELLDHQKDALILADVHRQLGEFSKALELGRQILADCKQEEWSRSWARRIIAESEVRNIFPVRINEDMELAPATVSYPECIDVGYYPFPVTEDVYAFADIEKETELFPLLSVHFSLVGFQEEGWATFCHNDHEERLYRHGRLFTREEWKEFLSWPDSVQNELLDFWEMKSFHLDQMGHHERGFYYRMLYRIYYGLRVPPTKELFDQHQQKFRPLWTRLRKELLSMEEMPDVVEWVRNHGEMVYWETFWGSFIRKEKLSQLNSKSIAFSIRGLVLEEKDRLEHQTHALEHLDYVELGKAADRKSGVETVFIGRFWSDYFGVGSELLSLFFNSDEESFYHARE